MEWLKQIQMARLSCKMDRTMLMSLAIHQNQDRTMLTGLAIHQKMDTQRLAHLGTRLMTDTSWMKGILKQARLGRRLMMGTSWTKDRQKQMRLGTSLMTDTQRQVGLGKRSRMGTKMLRSFPMVLHLMDRRSWMQAQRARKRNQTAASETPHRKLSLAIGCSCRNWRRVCNHHWLQRRQCRVARRSMKRDSSPFLVTRHACDEGVEFRSKMCLP